MWAVKGVNFYSILTIGYYDSFSEAYEVCHYDYNDHYIDNEGREWELYIEHGNEHMAG